MSSEVRQVNLARRPRSVDEQFVREVQQAIEGSKRALGSRYAPLVREASELLDVIKSGDRYMHDAPETLLEKVQQGIEIKAKTIRVAEAAGLKPEDLVGRSTVPREKRLDRPPAPIITDADTDYDEEALEELFILVTENPAAFGDAYQEICRQATLLGTLIEEGKQNSLSLLKFATRISDHVGVGPVNQVLFDSGWHGVNGVSLVEQVGHTVRDFISGAAKCVNCNLCRFRVPALPNIFRTNSPIK
jgi:hypothetical protein